MTLEQLNEQLTALRVQIGSKNPNHPREAAEIDNLRRQEAVLLQQIQDAEDLLKQQEELEQKIENKVEEAIALNVPGVDFTGLPAELIKIINIIVKADRRRLLDEHKEDITELHNETRDKLKEKDDQLLAAHEEVQKAEEALQVLAQSHSDLTTRFNQTEGTIAQLTLEKEEAEAKRDAAASELEEAQKEIERLKSEIDGYQRDKAYGVREQLNVIDITPEDSGAESVQDLVNSLKAKYVKTEDWGSVIKAVKEDGTFDVLKRDEYEKTVEAPELFTTDRGNQFRDEIEPEGNQLHNQDTAGNGAVVQSEVTGSESFRSEGTGLELVDGNTGLEVAGTKIEERVKVLEIKVEKLEIKVEALELAVFGQAKGETA